VSGRAGDLARSVDRDQGKALLGVELWAEIRRLKHVEGLSQREIHRRTGVHRDTIRNALASPTPPVYGPRAPRPSKLDSFVATIRGAAR
jgi:transposase